MQSPDGGAATSHGDVLSPMCPEKDFPAEVIFDPGVKRIGIDSETSRGLGYWLMGFNCKFDSFLSKLARTS